MEEDNKSYTECIFCSKADEEDMILIVKFLETCAESINSWIGNRSSNGDGLVVTDGTSRLRFSRIFKLRNFKKALNALLKQKYGDLGDCSHLHYCQKFTRFLLSFDDIAKEGSGGLIGGRENTPETSEKPKVHVEHAIKLFSLAIKKEWLRIAKVKTLFFDIEKKLSRIEEAHKLNALQVNNHAFEENLQKSESSDYREIARSKSSSFKDNRLGKRKRFDSKTRNVLEDWYLDNINNPYPSEETKIYLSQVTGLSSLQIKNWFINARKRCPIKERTTQRSETTSRKRHKNGLPNKSIERLARDQRSSLRKHVNLLSSEFEVFSFGTKSRKKTKQTAPEIAIPLPLKPKERNYLFGDLFSMKKTYNQQLIGADYQRSEIGFSDHNHTKLLSYEPTS